MFEMTKVKMHRASKHWPALVTLVSVGGIAYGVYKMCKASIELESTMAEHNIVENSIAESHDKGVINDEEYKKKIGKAKIERAKDITKLYAPGFLLVASSTFGFLFSNRELGKRAIDAQNLALQYHDSYQKLKKNVQEAVGKKATQVIEHNIKTRKEEVETVNEKTGKKSKRDMVIDTIDGVYYTPSVYSVFFNDTCEGFDADSRKNNYEYLMSIQDECRRRLRKKGYLWLIDIYNMLGIVPDTANKAVMNAGWIDPEGPYSSLICDTDGITRYDGVIDFGLNNIELHKNDANFEPVWLLDFNCYQISHLI